ncbi:MAG TPA: hypothetical protein VF276_14400 [Chloroflexia bacterium]
MRQYAITARARTRMAGLLLLGAVLGSCSGTAPVPTPVAGSTAPPPGLPATSTAPPLSGATATPSAPAATPTPVPPAATPTSTATISAARTVFYQVFRPTTVPDWLTPASELMRDETMPSRLVQHYDAGSTRDALVWMEGPILPGRAEPDGQSVVVGARQGRYSEQNGVRRLVLAVDGTEIELDGQANVTREVLIEVAASAQSVPMRVAVRLDATDAPVLPPAQPALFPLSFADPLHGWALASCPGNAACAPEIRATVDGGETWQPAGPAPANASQLRFTTPRDGWAFDPGFWATHDGGRTWTANPVLPAVSALEVAGDTVWAIAATPTGTVAPAATLYVSSDSGATWQTVSHPPITGPAWQLVRAGPDAGWILSWGNYGYPRQGPIGTISATQDAGRTWQPLPDPCVGVGGVEDRLAAADAHELWLLCGALPASGAAEEKALFQSTDSGGHWTLNAAWESGRHELPAGQVVDLAVPVPGHPWIVAMRPGSVYRPTAAGQPWIPAIPSDLASPGDRSVGSVQFIDAQHGWFSTAGDLFRTQDGGQTWDMLPHP